ncbi:hypothetical protein A4A49_60555, partial [Nicotiana attenuata]
NTQKWQKAETKVEEKPQSVDEESKKPLDNSKKGGNGTITPITQQQKVMSIVPGNLTNPNLTKNSFSCLYPKDIVTNSIEDTSSPHNSQNPLGNNSHITSTPTSYPLDAYSGPTAHHSPSQAMDLDLKRPTKSSTPSLMHNLGSTQSLAPILPMKDTNLTQQIPSTNQTQPLSNSSQTIINVQDTLNPRKDKSLVPQNVPHTPLLDQYQTDRFTEELKAKTSHNLSKNNLNNAKTSPQPKQETPKAKEECMDKTTNPSTTPNTTHLHHKANSTEPYPPIMVGMGPHGSCTKHKSPARREGSHNTNRGSLILGSNCDGRNANWHEQCDDETMVESPTAHAHEYGPPPLTLELPCSTPTPHTHAPPKPTHLPSPCKPSNLIPLHGCCPNTATITAQQQHTLNPTAQDITPLHPSNIEPNSNTISNPTKPDFERDGRGGRRGRNANGKNSGARSVKIPKNNGIPSKKRKKIHLKLPGGFEEMLNFHKEGEPTEHLPTCDGVSTNNILPLLDATGNDEERR